MNRIFQILILLLSLTLIQCSTDETSNESLLVNGAEFKIGSNSGSKIYNVLASENDNGFLVRVYEKAASPARIINILVRHEPGSHSGTYTLRNNFSAPGIAGIEITDDQNHYIAGGSIDGPTGTITVTDFGNNTFKIVFNDVVLDPGMGSETMISGNFTKTFSTN
jgi:hypothetical protein